MENKRTYSEEKVIEMLKAYGEYVEARETWIHSFNLETKTEARRELTNGTTERYKNSVPANIREYLGDGHLEEIDE
jgi:hypothetical protein